MTPTKPKPAPPTTPIETLVRELYGLGKVRREIARHALAELGTQGFNALAVVYVDGPMRVSEVAGRLGVDLSVASRQVTALTDGGYLQREADPSDRRAFLVSTTPNGDKVLKESHRRMVHGFASALAGWSEDEVAALSEGLARLSRDFAGLTEAEGAAR